MTEFETFKRHQQQNDIVNEQRMKHPETNNGNAPSYASQAQHHGLIGLLGLGDTSRRSASLPLSSPQRPATVSIKRLACHPVHASTSSNATSESTQQVSEELELLNDHKTAERELERYILEGTLEMLLHQAPQTLNLVSFWEVDIFFL